MADILTRRLAVLALVALPRLLSSQTAEPPSDVPAEPPVDSPATQPAPPEPDNPKFFRGKVSSITPDRIKVWRKLVGHEPETRVFVINAATRRPKYVKQKAEVIVRYHHVGDDDVALGIHVRPAHPFHNSEVP